MDLVQAGRLTEEQAREYLEGLRWPEGPKCPHCGSQQVTRLTGDSTRPGTIQCNECRQQFTVTVGTIMEDTHLPLQKWVMAFCMLCASKKGVSALQLQRQLGLGSYRTAWHLAHRIRHAMRPDSGAPMLEGTVEADETYVGGKPKKVPGQRNKRGRGTKKVPVVALVERGGRIRVQPMPQVTANNLRAMLTENVSPTAEINTDELPTHGPACRDFAAHETVNHRGKEYSRNGVHVNSCESFFALLKRGLHGAFHHVSKWHLFRYCDEFGFRWDHRKATDAERTEAAIVAASGKRLTYYEVRA